MRRWIVILAVFDLALWVLGVFAVVVSSELRFLGIAGLAVAVVITVALAFAARRAVSADIAESPSSPDGAGADDFDAATSLRNRPTWRDDVEGGAGPKW